MKTDSNTCACNNSRKDEEHIIKDSKKKKIISRYVEYVKMIMPAVVFTIIPKCPVCLAGYIALSTGIGLSIPTATYIRILLIIICILSIAYFVIKHVRRFIEQ